MIEQVLEGFRPVLRATEARLRLAPGTFEAIAGSSDWSFVVQLHALLESAATNLLTRWLLQGDLGEPGRKAKMERHVAVLGLKMKVEWARTLGLSQQATQQVLAISGIRNRVAHNISVLMEFSLPNHFGQLPAPVRRKLLSDLGFGSAPWTNRAPETTETVANEYLLLNPKGLLTLAACSALNDFEMAHAARRAVQSIHKAGLFGGDPLLAQMTRDAVISLLDRGH